MRIENIGCIFAIFSQKIEQNPLFCHLFINLYENITKMLVQFSVRNYKTFKDLSTLSLVASNYDKTDIEENTFLNRKFKYRLLKSAVLYGANASGKSKFFDAYRTFRNIVFDSSKESQADDEIS